MKGHKLAALRIAGLMWALVFGSLFGALHWQKNLNDSFERSLRAEGKTTFVNLERLQRKEKSLFLPKTMRSTSPKDASYFYTYSYTFNGRNYVITEQVAPELYYLHREGENLEAYRFIDSRGFPHTRLKENNFKPSRGALVPLAGILAILGAVLAIIGFLAHINPRW
ncbi:MAG: hypothetical protein KDK37_17020 [Leptospiraceae bacterium]|nr:hypothetical protein [Leptospiraceae bacterium]MCB1305994.1 hypothetical protein [Leptospiraceae bacterium]